MQLKALCISSKAKIPPPHAIHESVRRFYMLQQGKYNTAAAYQEQFLNIVDVIDATGGSMGNHKEILEAMAKEEGIVIDKAAPEQMRSMKAVAKERYDQYIEDFENSFLQGQDKYPKTVTAAYNLLTNWKQDPRNMMQAIGPVNDGVSFTNFTSKEETMALATQGKRVTKDKAHVTCFKCKGTGHYANECTSEEATGESMLMTVIANGEFNQDNYGSQFSQQGPCDILLNSNVKPNPVSKSWILLDNQSTVDVSNNKEVLKNMRHSTTTMNIHCNAGVATTNTIADLPGHGTVWYHPKGIANILSLSQVVKKGYHVMFDSKERNKFIVHKPDGRRTQVFKQSTGGIYYMDINENRDGIALLNTVEDNKTKDTKRDYSRALLSRNIQKIIGRPSTRDFMKIIENKLLLNCPITWRDIIIAENISGPDIGSLKGKTARHAPTPLDPSLVDIPPHIMNHYREVVLGGDIMFVNRLHFLSPYHAILNLVPQK